MRELFKSIGVSLDNKGPAGSWRDLFGYFRKNVIQIFDEIELAKARKRKHSGFHCLKNTHNKYIESLFHCQKIFKKLFLSVQLFPETN